MRRSKTKKRSKLAQLRKLTLIVKIVNIVLGLVMSVSFVVLFGATGYFEHNAEASYVFYIIISLAAMALLILSERVLERTTRLEDDLVKHVRVVAAKTRIQARRRAAMKNYKNTAWRRGRITYDPYTRQNVIWPGIPADSKNKPVR